jgi:hypothetical protein
MPNTACHCKKNGLEPLAVPTLFAALPVVHHPVVAVTFQIGTVNRRALHSGGITCKEKRRLPPIPSQTFIANCCWNHVA